MVAALYDATYDKTVDNTAASNLSMLCAGQRLHSEDSADRVTYDAGLLVGYRGSLGALAGIRRVETDFSRSYAGCLVSAGICQPGEFETGNEFFDEHCNAFSLGAGVEQQPDRVAIRGELRYIVHGSSAQLVLFDDLGVRVPTRLEASEIGLGVSLLWTC